MKKLMESWFSAVLMLSGLCLMACGVDAQAAANLLQVNNTTGWQIFAPTSTYDYRYGPSIMINSDNSIDMWTSSPGTGSAWDFIRYRRSTDGGHTWSADQTVLQPTANSEDMYSTCDPGVIKIGSYYYIGYTSTNVFQGSNHLYLARSTTQAGPYSKWNGHGWGGNPVPIISSEMGTAAFGLGEPSFVLYGGKLYIYYTYASTWTNFTNLAICDNPNIDTWPANLVLKGHVMTKAAGEDSMDIKYVDSMGRFIGVYVHNRMAANSTLGVMQSDDGILWQPSTFKGAMLQYAAHNVGISGGPDGHLDTSKSNFIAYANWPLANIWGQWPTYLDPITLSTATFGTPMFFTPSSTLAGWDAPKGCDGDTNTIWSSGAQGSASATEWAYVDLGANLDVTQFHLWPRQGGVCFPVDFKLEYSSNATNWTQIPGQSFTNYPNPGSSPVVATFSAVNGRYFRATATKLGTDGSNYYLMLSEIGIVSTTPSLPGSLSLTGPANGSTNGAVCVNFTWNASAGATSYRLVVADNAALNNPFYVTSGGTTNSSWMGTTQLITNTPLLDNTTYYWQVYALNGAGYTAASSVFSFTTAASHVGYSTEVKAFASSQYDASWTPANAIDFNNNTNWSSVGYGDNDNHTEWIAVNLGSINPITQLHVMPRWDGQGFPVDFKIQYSNDGTNWTDVSGQSYTNYPSPTSQTLQPFYFASTVSAQYFRVYATKLRVNGGSYFCQFADVNPVFLSTLPAADTISSRSAYSASSTLSGWDQSKAFDNNPSSCWSSVAHGSSAATEWLAVNTGAANLLKGVTLVPRPGGYCYPADFKLQYSANGSTWYDIPNMSFTGHATPGDGSITYDQTYTFSNVLAAQYLRVYATKLGTDGSSYYFMLAEIKPILYSNNGQLSCSRLDAHTTATTQLSGMESTKATDGSTGSMWSSAGHAGANYTETIQVNLGGNMLLKRVRIMPRTITGTTYCFPSAFRIEYSSDNINWCVAPGQNYSAFANPPATEQVFTLRTPVTAAMIRVVATTLRTDNYTTYYCQFAEINADTQ